MNGREREKGGARKGDANLLVSTDGRKRTGSEHRILLEAAGFEVTKIIPSQSEMTVIECTRVE